MHLRSRRCWPPSPPALCPFRSSVKVLVDAALTRLTLAAYTRTWLDSGMLEEASWVSAAAPSPRCIEVKGRCALLRALKWLRGATRAASAAAKSSGTESLQSRDLNLPGDERPTNMRYSVVEFTGLVQVQMSLQGRRYVDTVTDVRARVAPHHVRCFGYVVRQRAVSKAPSLGSN